MGTSSVGLTLVRTLVELHGGRVSAASEGSGRGSEFEVVLPARQLEPLAANPSAARAEPNTEDSMAADSGVRRILLVEDNQDALEVLSDLLAMWGHEVQGVPDGLSAVNKALAMQPDVALIDIGLPGIDGYEVARRIRAVSSGKTLKLVALTGGAGWVQSASREARASRWSCAPAA